MNKWQSSHQQMTALCYVHHGAMQDSKYVIAPEWSSRLGSLTATSTNLQLSCASNEVMHGAHGALQIGAHAVLPNPSGNETPITTYSPEPPHVTADSRLGGGLGGIFPANTLETKESAQTASVIVKILFMTASSLRKNTTLSTAETAIPFPSHSW